MATNDFVVKNGLVVNENATIKEATDASSSTDAAASVYTAGGLAVAKKAYVGTDLAVSGATTLTGDLAVNGGDITTSASAVTLFNSNATTVDAFESATTINIGAATGTTTVQNALTVNQAFTASGANVNVALSPTGTGAVTISPAGAVTLNPTTLGTINNMSIGATTASTGKFTNTTITGTLTANGGVGTAGQALVSTGTGIQWSTPDAITNGTTQVKALATSITATVSGTLSTSWFDTYVSIPLTAEASSTADGVLRIAGGVGIAKRLYAGSLQNTPIGSSVANTAAFTTLTANGQVSFTANTAAGNGTGTVTVTGGQYLSGGIWAGSTSTLAGLSSTSTTTLSPANASVTISPTGTGTVTINPATAGTINAMSIGATTAATGRFTSGIITTGNIDFSGTGNGILGGGKSSGQSRIWAYDSANLGYGAYYVEGATDSMRFDVSGAAQSGTPDVEIVPDGININGNKVWHLGNDGSGSGLDADLLDGLHLNTSGRANNANEVVRTDASGYIQAGWINTTSGDNGTTAIDRVYASNDGYIRYYTPTNFRAVLDVPTRSGGNASGTWAISISGNAATATDATNATNSRYLTSPDGDRLASTKLPTSNARAVRFDFVGAGEGNGAGNYAGLMTYAPWEGTSASTGDSSYQLAFGNQSGVNASGPAKLSIRNGINSTWNAWQTILTSSNYNSYAPTFTGTGASGTWGISVTGSAVTLSTTRSTWVTNGTVSAVVGQLGWRNYGNGHTIVDVSPGTVPDGTAKSSTNAEIVWSASYPTLVGWNGTNTYGVRVDVCRNADTVTNGFYTTGGQTVSGNTTFSGTMTANSIVESSSIRYKENVVSIDSALEKVLQLTGVTYDRKDGSRINEAGLIAEDVAKVLPNIIATKDGEVDGIQYTKLTAYLIECIKELNAKIDKLEGR